MSTTRRELLKYVDAANALAESVKRNIQKDGCIELPSSPGIGYAVDQAKIQKYKIASRSFPE